MALRVRRADDEIFGQQPRTIRVTQAQSQPQKIRIAGSGIAAKAPVDTRSTPSRLFDQINIFDNNRSFGRSQPTDRSGALRQGAEFGKNLAKELIAGPRFLVDSAILNPAREELAKLGGGQFQGSSLQSIRRNTNESLGIGRDAKDLVGGLRRVGGAGLETVSLGVGGGALTGLKAGVKPLAKFAAIEAAAGAAGNAGAELRENRNAGVADIAKSAAIGAVAGPVLAGTAGLAGKGVSRIVRGAADAPRVRVRDTPKTVRIVDESAIREALPELSDAEARAVVQNIENRPTAAKQVLENAKKINDAKTVEVETRARNTVFHVPGTGVYARLTPDSYKKLVRETENISASAGDVPHLSPLSSVQREGLREVPIEEVAKLSNNANQAAGSVKIAPQENTVKIAPTQVDEVPQALESVTVRAEEAAPVASEGTAQVTDPNLTQPARAADVPQQGTVRVAGAQEGPVIQATPEEISAKLGKQSEPARIEEDGGIKGMFNKIKRVIDPASELVRLDKTRAKALGVDRVPQSESLSNSFDFVKAMQGRTGDDIVLKILKDEGVLDIVGKYSGEDAKAFRRYQNVKFALEVKQKTGKDVLRIDGRPLTLQEMGDYIRAYEASNTSAVADARALKGYSDKVLDAAADSGLISRADAEFVKSRYKNYAPIDRLFPEDLARPELGINPVGTISRQKILQNIEGSDLPISETFDVYQTKTKQTLVDSARAEFGRKVASVAQEGSVEGLSPVLTKNQSLQLKETRELLKDVRDLRDKKRNQYNKMRSVSEKLTPQEERLSRDIGNKVRSLLRETVLDPDAQAAIGTISNRDALDLIGGFDGEGGTKRLADSLKKTNLQRNQIDTVINDIENTLQGLDNTSRNLVEEVRILAPDSTTGRQVVTTLDEGVQVKTEVTPEVAKVLQGLENQKQHALVKFFSALQKPFRATYTGVLNPTFQAISFAAFDPPMAIINSPQGFKTLLSPDAWKKSISLTKEGKEFREALQRNGAQLQTSTYQPRSSGQSLEYAASDPMGKVVHTIKNPKDAAQLIDKLDTFGAALSNSTRQRIAAAHYKAAKKANLSEADALADAVHAFNNVMPNYARTSNLMKIVDAFVPYSAASVAGTRAFGQAVSRNPVKTLAKAASFLAPAFLAVTHNLTQTQGQEFYADMEEQGNDFLFENNIIIVTPGAKKNQETGEWSGIIKFPVAPELRALTGAVQREISEHYRGEGADVGDIARAVFDTATGQLFKDPSNPFFTVAAGLGWNKNVAFGGDVVPQDMENLPPEEQVFKSTSGIAKAVGGKLGISPIKVDHVLNQLSSVGDILQGRPVTGELTERFYGARGVSEGRGFFIDRDATADLITDPETKTKFEAMHSSNSGLTTSQRAEMMLRDEELFKAEKSLHDRQKARGKDTDPLWDLPENKIKTMLSYQFANNTPNSPEADNILRHNPWMIDTFKARGEYFDKIFSDKETEADTPRKPIPTPEISSKLNTYSTIEDSAQKFQYLEDNPEIGEYWDKVSQYNRAEREILGLPQQDEYPELNERQQSILDTYYSLPSGTGQRKAFIKQNPELVAIWAVRNIYTLQQEAIKSQFENEEFSQKGFSKVAQLAANLLKLPDGSYVIDPNTYNRIAEAGGSGGSGGFGGSSGGSSKSKTLKVKPSVVAGPKVRVKSNKVTGKSIIAKGKKASIKTRKPSSGGKIKIKRIQ